MDKELKKIMEEQLEIAKQLLDYTKGLHKEMREIKVRLMEKLEKL